ncbi:MAG: (deoxy)nucleoside triphosphate pyrophosphohydrolase [Clostridia bacterium]|nr:(deoxy)nucleoside triphosphate pyrophosphohydrolase [Clostridia bacterium]
MQKTKRAIEVVAALIVRGDRFLACQRPPEKARGLLWEFVGGKVEAGESGPEALVRECREELDVVLSVGEAIMDVTHAYPDLTVHLTLYRSRIAQGEPKLIEHHDLRWITAEEIGDYEFCPADQAFLEEIRRKGLA